MHSLLRNSKRHPPKPFIFFYCWRSFERKKTNSHGSDSSELFGTWDPPQGQPLADSSCRPAWGRRGRDPDTWHLSPGRTDLLFTTCSHFEMPRWLMWKFDEWGVARSLQERRCSQTIRTTWHNRHQRQTGTILFSPTVIYWWNILGKKKSPAKSMIMIQVGL